MPSENGAELLEDDQDTADFTAGFTGKESEKPKAKEKTESAEIPREEVESQPEYVQLTKSELAELKAAAAKTASYDQQLSKAFGTLGNLQKIVNGIQSQTPRGGKLEIPADAFAEMEKDFPELAQQTRAALSAALSGMTGTGAADTNTPNIEQLLVDYTSKRELKVLEEEWPNWREIVGAVDATKEQPNPEHPFRKWLSTKDAAYQARINGTESAAVIDRAIQLFQKETKELAKPAKQPADTARADRIREAVKPKGDNAIVSSSKSEDDEFVAGFNSR